MKRKLIIGLLILSLIAVPLFAIACEEEVTPPAEQEEEEEEEEAPPISITIAYPGGFMGGLPSVDPCDFANGGPPNPNVFETLIGQDKDDELIGLLAEDWSWSADGKTLTVNLRHDVVFSTGDPFTSADVLFSLDRHLEKNMPVIAQFSPEQGVEGYEADGDYTVVFHFSKVNVQFVPQTLTNTGIISKTYYDRVGEDAYIALPVGTGPYKIDSWAEGQYVDLVYNDKYRGDKPQIDSAHFVVYGTPATGVAMLEAGEVDMVSQVPGASITTLEDEGYNRIDILQAHALALQFNLLSDDAPWNDVRVRQAINYAIDKESLAEAMIAGPIEEGTWAFPTAPWYDPSLKPAYDYDLAMARQLMEDANYADGFVFPVTYNATETLTPLADYLASALDQINITVELTSVSGMPELMPAIAAVHNARLNGEEVPSTPGAFLCSTGWPGNPEVSIDLTNSFYWGKDNTLFYDEDITALIDQVLSTLDDETRWDIARQAWAAINALLPEIPIGVEYQVSFSTPNITYTKTHIGGMNMGPTQLVDLTVS
jgi:ABC-type transport system substrate-binding protein